MSAIKVAIFTEGGQGIGLGHVTRCVSLSQAFEERGIEPQFFVHGDQGILRFLEGRPVTFLDWFRDETALQRILSGNDIAIVDSYLAGSTAYELIVRVVKVALYIDDNNRLPYPPGIVLNACPATGELGYSPRDGVQYLFGSSFIPLRKEFWDVAKKSITENPTQVLVTIGGTDIRNLTPRILDFLSKHFPHLEKVVLAGKANQEQVQDCIRRDKTIRLIDVTTAAAMKDIMQQSDLAISAGGQTLYELARMGVPTIGICVADNQILNLREGQRQGFLRSIENFDERQGESELTMAVKSVMEKRTRASMSEAGQRSVDGQGSRRVAQEVLTDYFRRTLVFRPTIGEDAKALFELANSPEVRENSFNPNPILWDDHVRWLQQKLQDRNTVFFIIASFSMFCGQVRFDLEFPAHGGEASAVISIGLHPSVRGLNLSPYLIDRAVQELLKIHKIQIVKAYIRGHNNASLKAFTRANFTFHQDVLMNQFPTKLYVRRTESSYAK